MHAKLQLTADADQESELTLTAEELLLGTQSLFDLVIPQHILQPGAVLKPEAGPGDAEPAKKVVLRPLSLKTFQLILNASKHDSSQIPLLMIRESMVTPSLTLPQISILHIGLVDFLVEHIQLISGLSEKKTL